MDEGLLKKLNFKEGDSSLILNAPDNIIQKFKGLAYDDKPQKDKYSFVIIFLYKKENIPAFFEKGIKNLADKGKLWFCYTKQSSELKSDITRDDGWDVAANHEFIAVRQVAINEDWSALRFKSKNEVKKVTRNSPKELVIPSTLQHALNANPFCKEFFNSLSNTNKKEYAEWISSARKEETARSRLEQTIEKLKAGKKNPGEK